MSNEALLDVRRNGRIVTGFEILMDEKDGRIALCFETDRGRSSIVLADDMRFRFAAGMREAEERALLEE